MSGVIDSFGEIELDFGGVPYGEDDEVPDTTPLAGTAHLIVQDRCMQLFLTAEWTLVATVGQHELGRSSTINASHTPAYTKRWARQLIRSNKARLRRLGVDVEQTYLQWGGVIADLED